MNTKLVIGLALLAILVSVVSILVCQKYLVFPKKEVKKEVNNDKEFDLLINKLAELAK